MRLPASRGLQGRHAFTSVSDIGADPPVALPALSREVGVATTAAGTSGTTPYLSMRSANNTTLACVLTDAALDKISAGARSSRASPAPGSLAR